MPGRLKHLPRYSKLKKSRSEPSQIESSLLVNFPRRTVMGAHVTCANYGDSDAEHDRFC